MSKISPKVTKQIQAHNGLTAEQVTEAQIKIDALNEKIEVEYQAWSELNLPGCAPQSHFDQMNERRALEVLIGTYTPVYPSDNPYRFLNSSLDEDAQYWAILRG